MISWSRAIIAGVVAGVIFVMMEIFLITFFSVVRHGGRHV